MSLIDRTPIRDQVYRVVLGGIVSGESSPGTQIKDTALADQLGVSRTPVREALLRLTQEGFLESTPGRGFSVRRLELQEIRESFPILWTLEALALSLSGPLSEATLGRLEELNAQLEREHDDATTKLELDGALHDTLVSSCKNNRLLEAITQLRRVIRRYELAYMTEADLVGSSVREHSEIIGLLRQGKNDRAATVLTRHWQRSSEAIAAVFESGEASGSS
jgi:DNA-binding GntR family transcriptional regulator